MVMLCLMVSQVNSFIPAVCYYLWCCCFSDHTEEWQLFLKCSPYSKKKKKNSKKNILKCILVFPYFLTVLYFHTQRLCLYSHSICQPLFTTAKQPDHFPVTAMTLNHHHVIADCENEPIVVAYHAFHYTTSVISFESHTVEVFFTLTLSRMLPPSFTAQYFCWPNPATIQHNTKVSASDTSGVFIPLLKEWKKILSMQSVTTRWLQLTRDHAGNTIYYFPWKKQLDDPQEMTCTVTQTS